MALEEYRSKRDFARTPEPAGQAPSGTPPPIGHRFVVHRHRARRLHYDLRLEVEGVLVSWAIPKGPTLDPAARRMAILVEDHPLEYFDFEGVIPAGQYGAGDVIVWDWGTWQPEEQTPDPAGALHDGELKFTLTGQKLRGRFVLVRTRVPTGPADQWLLIHKRDEHSVAGWDAQEHPRSVRSGLTNEQVAAGAPAVWTGVSPPRARPDLARAVAAPLPRFIEPMRATPAHRAFDDEEWLFEVKWDGFRVQALVAGDGEVRLLTRNGHDAATYFPALLRTASWIDAQEAIVDGEVVALDAAGNPDFALLQERLGQPAGPGTVLEAFDLLHLDGHSLLGLPLEERKSLLHAVLREDTHVRYAGHVLGTGTAFLAAAAERGLEGIVAKRRTSTYQPGQRSPDWLKIKLRPEQELVVAGWTPQQGTGRGLGALVVAVHEGGRLRYAGKVGTGFTERARSRLLEALAPLRADAPPLEASSALRGRGAPGSGLSEVTWVRPELVIRAELAGWTRDGLVRHAAFKGIDPGRDPHQVVREPVADRLPAGPADKPRDAPDPGSGLGPQAHARGPSVAAGTGARRAVAAAPPDAGPRIATEQELQGLAGMTEGTWSVAGQGVRLTNLDKVLFPARGQSAAITKRELIAYFATIAPALLPHLAGRPLNLHRYPNGIDRPGFWQKNIPASAPRWLTVWPEPAGEGRRPNNHLVATDVATLAWLANQAAFELHAWTSTCADPQHPTFALVDIDPGTATTWPQTLTLARLFRTALDHLGLRGLPKTTGSRGIQIWIPVTRGKYDFAATSAWVEALSRAVGAAVPDLVSWEWARAGRAGRARLDYTQNSPMHTLVAPYAVRPAPGAPVSMPITWAELDDPDLRSDRWTIREAPARLARHGDLFAAAQTVEQDLPRL